MNKQLNMHDNLRFQDMAKAKAIRDGDLLTYDLVEKRLMTKPSQKALALSLSTDHEAYEREKFMKDECESN